MSFSICIPTVPVRESLFSALATNFGSWLGHAQVLGLHVSGRADFSLNENSCRALEAAAGDGSEGVVFVQDDAGPIRDFVGSTERWLEAHQVEDVHVYPLAHAYALDQVCLYLPTPDAQRWNYPIEGFFGAVALVIRASMVPSLITYIKESGLSLAFDILVGRWHRSISQSTFLIAPIPCFVDHLGSKSTIGNTVGQYPCFLGQEWAYCGPTHGGEP